MVLYGWGHDEKAKKSYWILRNSWGDDWGSDGSVKIEMDDHWDACGMYKNVVELK